MELLLGLYIIAVGITGNIGGLLEAVSKEAGFIPWIIAIGIARMLYANAPQPVREPVRSLIWVSAAAVVIADQKNLIAGVKQAWASLKSLGTGSGITEGVSSGASAVSNLSTAGSAGTTGQLSASQTSFLQSIMPSATQVATELGVPTSAILAQTALETAFGTSSAYQNLNNPAGINVPGGNGEQYQAYSSPQAGISALGNLVMSRYPDAMSQGVAGYANALQAGGYATDPNYANKIISLSNEIQSNMGVQ